MFSKNGPLSTSCQRRNLGCYSPCHYPPFPTCNQPPPSAGSTSFIIFIYLSLWLCWVLVAACRIFSSGMQTLSCSMWDLAPWPGTEPRTPTRGVWSLSHWTTREVPCPSLIGGVWTDCYGWFLFCGVLYFYLDQLWFEFNVQVRRKGLITLYFM